MKVSLKFVFQGPIDNNSAFVQVMAWRPEGSKPLPEPMMTGTCEGSSEFISQLSPFILAPFKVQGVAMGFY